MAIGGLVIGILPALQKARLALPANASHIDIVPLGPVDLNASGCSRNSCAKIKCAVDLL